MAAVDPDDSLLALREMHAPRMGGARFVSFWANRFDESTSVSVSVSIPACSGQVVKVEAKLSCRGLST